MERRIERDVLRLAGGESFDVEPDDGGLVLRERVERSGNFPRNAGAHQHAIDPGQHRPIERGLVRELQLRQEVDTDLAVVALLGKVHLDEVRKHRQLLAGNAHRLLVHRNQLVRLPRPASFGAEIPCKRGRADFGNRERLHRAPDVSAKVTILEAPDEDRIKRGARHDAELAAKRYGARQHPVRDPGAHTALDNDGQRTNCAH